MSEVTHILEAAQQGDPLAAEQLLPLVYDELRKLAAAKLAREKNAHTWQPTALVHEAWLRLVGTESQWNGRGHFFAAAEAMCRILIESARRKHSQKQGVGWVRTDLEESMIVLERPTDEMLAVHEALEKPTPQEQVAFLEAACGTDAALRRRVEALLNQFDQLDTFLEKPVLPQPVPDASTKPNPSAFTQTALMGPLTERLGDPIGRYKLLQQIGEGGCGVVYMAEQEEPIRRRVALKIIIH